ncbi:DUF2779 domain-containing protein [Candidatus Saccharibacteria bacterium]|nr:MAG: DUF2779 domain-containing protein [Candidatus Saccharibacteria bacterium]
MISKSDYMLFLKHPAWLWVKKHDPGRIPPVDDATQAMFDAGHAFEPYVESLFPEGVTLGFGDYDEYLSLPVRTRQALESGARILFQPRFEWKDFTCISDIVSVVEGNTVDLYEIKSSTKVKPEHLYDLAFQKVVLEGNGLSVRNTSVIHVNNQYVRRGEVNPRELTAFEDVTGKVNEIAAKTPGYMQVAAQVVQSTTMPDPNPNLTKLGAKAEWLQIYENIFPPEPKVWPEDTAPTIDKQAIAGFLNDLTYPLYFLDYETMSGIIPHFDGQRPYQQVPMQYSLHILQTPDGELEHREFLHRDNSDPARPLVEQLVGDVGTEGSVIVWFEGFEKSRNAELGEMFPEYRVAMAALNDRVVDLIIPFKKKWYDDPRFEGSASIKKVLPVLCPELSYKTLGIQEGGSAQRLWMEAVLDGTREAEKEKILADLLEYCGLDTLAMVEIYRRLREQ